MGNKNMTRKRKAWIVALVTLTTLMLLPEWPRMPVQGATARDWNAKSFWYEPWGASGVHKGIDVFARKGTPLVAPTYGMVVFRGSLKLGGKVIVILGPKLRMHYFAHLHSMDVYPGYPVWNGRRIGSVGDTGNAQGKLAHLHYSAITLLPYPWRIDSSTQGWRKMFYLDPVRVLRLQ
jgi:murein DD-endopeptidase MepM/ murein hydrolase activator NlpD